MVSRGDIWLVHLDPASGSEIRKTRPCVVISPPEIHNHLRTLMVAPMTTRGFPPPFRIAVQHAGKQGLILLDQIRAVDRSRLAKHAGKLAPETLSATLTALRDLFAQ